MFAPVLYLNKSLRTLNRVSTDSHGISWQDIVAGNMKSKFENIAYCSEHFKNILVHVCMYVCVPSARSRVSDLLELELQMVVSHHVDAGN